jgi:hypothetical protein
MPKFRRRTELHLPVAQHVATEAFRAPTLADIETLARAKTEAALNVLAAIMFRETANAFARVAAANAILDRGWGKPVQPFYGRAAARIAATDRTHHRTSGRSIDNQQ